MANQGKQDNLNSWIKNVTDTLPHFNRRDVVTFAVCLVISTAFWFAATAYQKRDATFYVKLNIEGQPASAVFTTHVPTELKVTLYDTNSHLLSYSYQSSLKTLTVDFARYADVAGNFRISGAELQSLLLNNLKSTTQITAISPALVDARYAMTQGKKVPVRLSGVYTAADNHRDYAPILSPDSVTIHAPSYILDTLRCIYTLPLCHYGLKDTLRLRQPIDLAVGVKATPDTIGIVLPVVQYVEKVLNHIPIIATDLPQGKSLTLFPREASVRMLATFERYHDIQASDFRLTVSYDSIHSERQQFLKVALDCQYDSTILQGIRITPQQVEYSIEE